LSPLAVLRRGYSLVRRVPDGSIVRSAAALAPGDEVQISFAEGAARARILAPAGRRRAPKGETT
jgi:exodeoxyribonuclease VII large subunit